MPWNDLKFCKDADLKDFFTFLGALAEAVLRAGGACLRHLVVGQRVLGISAGKGLQMDGVSQKVPGGEDVRASLDRRYQLGTPTLTAPYFARASLRRTSSLKFRITRR